MKQKRMLILTLLTTLCMLSLVATYSWFSSSKNAFSTTVVQTGILSQISLSGDIESSGVNSSTDDVYSGQKAYQMVGYEYKPYTNEDAPYWFSENVSYTAIGDKSMTVKFSLDKVVINMARHGATIADIMLEYFDIDATSDSFDMSGYLQTFDAETLTYTDPENDKGVFFMSTDTGATPNKNSNIKAVVLTTKATDYFFFKYWASNLSGNVQEPTTQSAISLSYPSSVSKTGVVNYVKFKIGYYGKALDDSTFQLGQYCMPFMFSTNIFMGSNYEFHISAEG